MLMEEFLNGSLLNWASSTPTVSPVKVAQTKKLRKLSLGKNESNQSSNNNDIKNGFNNETDMLRLEKFIHFITVVKLKKDYKEM